MSAMMPARRATLAASYRGRSEVEIRALLEGELGESERVVARAELLRRGLGSDAQDTAPATGFEPTGIADPQAPDLAPAPASVARDAAAPRGGRRTWKILGALVLVLLVAGALALAQRAGIHRP
jgi:hypothetical protein